jgi:hypothetical protein
VDIVLGTGVSLTASVTDKRISKTFKPKDRFFALFVVELSAVVETNAIVFKLKDSFDGGQTWFNVGDQSQATIVKKTFANDSDVDPTTEQITVTSHGFATGEKLLLAAAGAGVLPTGLAAGAYYAISVDANTLKLATTQENALAGTAVNITADGSGNAVLAKAFYEIRMIKEDATDLAQLPLHDVVAVFATTGASDTATVAAVYATES